MKVPPRRQRNDALAMEFPDQVPTRRPSDCIMTSEEIGKRKWEEAMLKQSRERYERTMKRELEKEIRDTMTKTDV
ncbi:MAG: hypothetical protein L6R38_003929, partial [Xanthoria sp. 2 TBL-2021]